MHQREKGYSVYSLIMIFFTMSLAGWLWEVCLHAVVEGGFVNRGFLHGPWLPIYGLGSVLLVSLLWPLRKKPLREFLAIVLLCGCVEYAASWLLELLYNGMRWWNYSGYFLNLDGRICIAGLLGFGIGGMLIVNFAAPILDRLFRRLPKKILVSICLILTILFSADLAVSVREPNTGEGITGQEICA